MACSQCAPHPAVRPPLQPRTGRQVGAGLLFPGRRDCIKNACTPHCKLLIPPRARQCSTSLTHGPAGGRATTFSKACEIVLAASPAAHSSPSRPLITPLDAQPPNRQVGWDGTQHEAPGTSPSSICAPSRCILLCGGPTLAAATGAPLPALVGCAAQRTPGWPLAALCSGPIMADNQAAQLCYSNLPAELLRRIFAEAGDGYKAPLSVKDRFAHRQHRHLWMLHLAAKASRVLHADRSAGLRLQAGSGSDVPGLAARPAQPALHVVGTGRQTWKCYDQGGQAAVGHPRPAGCHIRLPV